MKFLWLFFVMMLSLTMVDRSLAFPVVESYREAFLQADSKTFVSTRAVTHGPQGHWFGYYDKLQLDPSGRFLLAMQVDFDARSPKPDDVLQIGMVDLQNDDKWIQLGQTRAWGWQQGCMLQWLPDSRDEVVWNDREGDHFVARILDTRTRQMRTLPRPVYYVSPDGKTGLTLNFERVEHLRRGYGYAGVSDATQADAAPADAGIFRIDMQTGASKLILSIADIAGRPYRQPHPADVHWFNHIQWNTDGSRFVFLHRWKPGGSPKTAFVTRAFTAAPDGSDIRILSERPGLSHFEWRDSRHILFWIDDLKGYVMLTDDGQQKEELLLSAPNGHNRFLPNHPGWILTDTYPWGSESLQYLYLYHLESHRLIVLNRFYQGAPFKGTEWRVDLHPRISSDGNQVAIDSRHEGARQIYLLDITGVIDSDRGVILKHPTP